MSEHVSWAADDELVALLRRYYGGEAELWPAIQARVHAGLRERGLPVGPHHIRFRARADGYAVIVEGAEGSAAP